MPDRGHPPTIASIAEELALEAMASARAHAALALEDKRLASRLLALARDYAEARVAVAS